MNPSTSTPSPSLSDRPYFDDRPTSSLTPTLQTSSSSPDSLPSQPGVPPTKSRFLRLFISGRDLPEPDVRSRASYAVVYHAQEAPTRISDVSAPPSPPRPPMDPSRKQSGPALVRALSKPVAHLKKTKSSALRAPSSAASFAAPEAPELVLSNDGAAIIRSPWLKLGTTEVARKFGRDVEFARSFSFQYCPGAGQVIRVAFYDCTSKNVEKQRLIGTAQFRVSAVYAAKGRPVTFPLKFLPVTESDVKRSNKIPDGSIVVAADRVDAEPRKYHLDVECNSIVRAKAMSTACVKRAFYTIHAVLDKEPKSDYWTLIFRSHTVEMIHRKKDGGSLEYNYFTSRRLVAKPGVVIEDTEGKAKAEAAAYARGESVGSSQGMFGKVAELLGVKPKVRFFSLPGASLQLKDQETRLKLSLFEDNGVLSGYDLIADTEFSIADLKQRKLGDSEPIRVHANTVGKAALKYVECSQDPGYFCLSLEMQGLR